MTQKIQDFIQLFNENGKTTSSDFMKLLDLVTNEPGVNDFSVPFHRNAFDYCSGYYVIVKVDGLYNLIYYDWSQYSGYHYQLISTIWFTKIFTHEGCIYGTSESFAYNHIEYDYNAARGVCHPISSILKVKSDHGFNFIYLQSYKMQDCLLVKGKWFESVTDWENGERFDIKNCIVTIEGKRYRLTSSGGLTDTTKNLNVELNVAKEVFKSKDKIINDWIMKGRLCGFRYGWAYRGAGWRIISKEEALEKIKHHSFGMGFYTMDFEISSAHGDVVLIFNELSENDMW